MQISIEIGLALIVLLTGLNVCLFALNYLTTIKNPAAKIQIEKAKRVVSGKKLRSYGMSDEEVIKREHQIFAREYNKAMEDMGGSNA